MASNIKIDLIKIDGLAKKIDDAAYRLNVVCDNIRNKTKEICGTYWSGVSAAEFEGLCSEVNSKADTAARFINDVKDVLDTYFKKGQAVDANENNIYRQVGTYSGSGNNTLEYNFGGAMAVAGTYSNVKSYLQYARDSANAAATSRNGLVNIYNVPNPMEILAQIDSLETQMQNLYRAFEDYYGQINNYDRQFSGALGGFITQSYQEYSRIRASVSVSESDFPVGSVFYRAQSITNFLGQLRDNLEGANPLVISDDIKKLNTIIRTMKEPYRTVVLAYLHDAKLRFFEGDGPSYFSGNEGMIYLKMSNMRNNSKTNPNYQTIFHELGHLIDFEMGNRSNMSDISKLYETQKKDVDNALRTSIDDLISKKNISGNTESWLSIIYSSTREVEEYTSGKFRNVYFDENGNRYPQSVADQLDLIRTDMNSIVRVENKPSSGVSDIYGGFTGNIIDGGWTHSNSYWRNDDGTAKNAYQGEGWGSWVGDHCVDFEGAEEVYANAFPETNKIYSELTNNVVEELKELGWEMPWE
jgi:uncharacterized protein YukE